MGIWDRDYNKPERSPGGGTDWRSRLPPRGTLALIVAHLLGFFAVAMARRSAGPGIATLFVLEGASSHPAAILLHPIGGSLLTLAFIIGVIWTLGARVESRLGTSRLVSLYLLGTIISGAVYFAFAQRAPELAEYALAMPAGALAAWALAAWRSLSDELVSVFGRLVTVAKAASTGAVIVAFWVFFWNGPAATGWLLAAAAGSLAWPLVNVVRRDVRAASGSRRLRPARSAPPQPLQEEAPPAADGHTIDDILAKISREGREALTPAERERLETARQARLRQSR